VRKRRPQIAPSAAAAPAEPLGPSADSARHHAWKAARPSTIMSAVPFTATTCCHTGTATKSPRAESHPAGAPNILRPRSKESHRAAPNRRTFRTRRK